MECFLTNFNPQKRPPEANSVEQREKRKKYEKEKRKREFLQSWKASYRWLENTDQEMVCKIYTKFDKTGTFVTGCKNFKRDSINQHEKSEVNVIKFNSQQNPEKSQGARALQAMNQLTVSRLVYIH